MMSLCKVGNQTSSQDPQAVNSRIFVGNLNTFQVTKTDVEKVFQRYGRIAGISMHKGYAFVQFTSPFDARSACLGEDGRSISSQIIDVNMVSEPKPHNNNNNNNATNGANGTSKIPVKVGAKRGHNDTGVPEETSAQFDENINESSQPGGERPSKIARTDRAALLPRPPIDFKSLKSYDSPDTLICGNCKEMFHDIHDLINHKKHYCKLRFTCKCSGTKLPSHTTSSRSTPNNGMQSLTPHPPNGMAETSIIGVGQFDGTSTSSNSSGSKCDISLLCNTCNKAFSTPWELILHAQTEHSMRIFEMEAPEENEEESSLHNVPQNTTAPAPSSCHNQVPTVAGIMTSVNGGQPSLPVL